MGRKSCATSPNAESESVRVLQTMFVAFYLLLELGYIIDRPGETLVPVCFGEADVEQEEEERYVVCNYFIYWELF